MMKIEGQTGREICRKLESGYHGKMRQYYLNDREYLWGYMDEFGLIFVPFGDWVEVYSPDECDQYERDFHNTHAE